MGKIESRGGGTNRALTSERRWVFWGLLVPSLFAADALGGFRDPWELGELNKPHVSLHNRPAHV